MHHRKLGQLLTKVDVPTNGSWEARLLFNFPQFFQKFLGMNEFRIDRLQQTGKGIEEIDRKSLRCDGHTFELVIFREEDRYTMSIVRTDTDEVDCVTVFIDEDLKYAILENMYYDESCAKDGLKKPGGGTILLNCITAYLMEHKDELGINRIVLRDNSHLSCPRCPHQLSLARLRTVTEGDTWYGKHGFRPFNIDENIPDRKRIREYDHNRRMFRRLKSQSLVLIKMAQRAVYKYKLQHINMTDLSEEINNAVEQNVRMKDLIKYLLRTDFDRYCCIVKYILDKIFESDVLYDFHGTTFYLDL